MTAAAFWRLTPAEVWWLVEDRKPVKMYGAMTETQVAEIYEETYGAS